MRDVESEAEVVSSDDKWSMVVDLKTPTPITPTEFMFPGKTLLLRTAQSLPY